jgi:hypothetical protein
MITIKNVADWLDELVFEDYYSGPSLREAKLAMAQDIASVTGCSVEFYFYLLRAGRDYEVKHHG